MFGNLREKYNLYIKSDKNFAEILRGGSIAFGVKVLSAFVVFFFNILLAKKLGVEDVGLYYLAFSVVNIGVMLGRFGTDKAQLRFIAPLVKSDQWIKIKSIYLKGNLFSFIFSALVSVTVFFCADLISVELFKKPALEEPLKLFSLAIVPLSLIWNHVEVFKAVKKVLFSVSLQGVVLPLTVSIFLIALHADELSLVVSLYTFTCFVVVVLGIYLWTRFYRRKMDSLAVQPSNEKILPTVLLKSAYPLFLASLGAQILQWTPTFLLGRWGTDANIGEYNIANKIAGLIIFLQFAVNTILAPKIGELIEEKKFDQIASLSKKISVFIVLATFPLVLLMLVHPDFLLGVFGEDFKPAANTLRILSLGYFLVLFLPPVTLTLMITGNEKSFRNVVLLSAFVMLLSGFLLVPRLNSVGAAISFVLAGSVQLISGVIILYRKFGIYTIPDIKYLNKLVKEFKA